MSKDLFILIGQEDNGFTWPISYHLELENAISRLIKNEEDCNGGKEFEMSWLKRIDGSLIDESDYCPSPIASSAIIVSGYYTDENMQESNYLQMSDQELFDELGWCNYYIIKVPLED